MSQICAEPKSGRRRRTPSSGRGAKRCGAGRKEMGGEGLRASPRRRPLLPLQPRGCPRGDGCLRGGRGRAGFGFWRVTGGSRASANHVHAFFFFLQLLGNVLVVVLSHHFGKATMYPYDVPDYAEFELIDGTRACLELADLN